MNDDDIEWGKPEPHEPSIWCVPGCLHVPDETTVHGGRQGPWQTHPDPAAIGYTTTDDGGW